MFANCEYIPEQAVAQEQVQIPQVPRRKRQPGPAPIGFTIVLNNLDVSAGEWFYVKEEFVVTGTQTIIYVLHVFYNNGESRSYAIDGLAVDTINTHRQALGMERALDNARAMLPPGVPCLGYGGDAAPENNLADHLPVNYQRLFRFFCMQHLIIRTFISLFDGFIYSAVNPAQNPILVNCGNFLMQNHALAEFRTRCETESSESAYHGFIRMIANNQFALLQPLAITQNEIEAIHFIDILVRCHRLLNQNMDAQAFTVILNNLDRFRSPNTFARRNIARIRETINFYIDTANTVPVFTPIHFTTWHIYAIRAVLRDANAQNNPTLRQVGRGMTLYGQQGYDGIATTGFGVAQLVLTALPNQQYNVCFRPFWITNFANLEQLVDRLQGNQQIVIPNINILNTLLQNLPTTRAQRNNAYRYCYAISRHIELQPCGVPSYSNFQGQQIGVISAIMQALSDLFP